MVLFDYALGLIGAIGAPVYPNSSPNDCAYMVGHSELVGVLAENDEQLAKVKRHRAELTRLSHGLTFADLQELEAHGREFAAAHPDALDEAPPRSARRTSSPTSTPRERPGPRRAA